VDTRHRLLSLAVAAATLVAVPAASACTVPTTRAASATRLVSYSASGGIAGRSVLMKVSSTGRVLRSQSPIVTCGPSLNYTMTARQLTKLKALIRAAKLSTLKRSYSNYLVSDAITETVKVPGVPDVSVSTGASGVPSRLNQLLAYLQRLSDR
jgi:hypothetical protein